MKLNKYTKAIVAAVAAVGSLITVVASDGTITVSEGITLALAVLGAIGVYRVPNAQEVQGDGTAGDSNTQ